MYRLLASQASQIPKIIIDDKYMLGDEIGRGGHGIVYKGLNLENGDFVAIKQISLENVEDEDLKTIMQEIDLLKNLNHKNIVKYLGSSKTKSHLHIILEYMENGSFANIIKPNNFGPFPEPLVAMYIAQVLEGLVYLHEQGVIHRDIKGANILTTKEGLVKLADFGVATKLTETNIDQTSYAGTAYWMAPEVINMSGVCGASDIWSVGCTVIELLTGLPPYYNLQPCSALWNIAQDKQPPIPVSLSPDVTDFVRQCFEKDHRQRLDAKTLLSHPWIQRSRRVVHSSLCHNGTSRSSKEYCPVDAQTSNGDDQHSVNNLPAKNAKDSKEELLSVYAADTDKDTERNPLEDISDDPEKQAVEYSKLVSSLRPDEEEDVIVSASQKLAAFFHQRPEQKFVFLTQHGFLPLVELLDVPKNRVICAVLQVLNKIIRDNTKIQEDACLAGLIPSIMSFAVPDQPSEIRLEATYFLHQLCHSSSLTLHMFIACRGISILVGFLEADYSKHREVVHIALDGLWKVFKLQRSTLRGDFCHIAAKNGLLLKLINTIHSLNEAIWIASISGGGGLPSDAVVLRQMSGDPKNPAFGPNESNYNVKHRRTENLLPSVTCGSSHASVSNFTDSRNFSLDADGHQPNSPSTSSVEATTSLRLLGIASHRESGAQSGTEVLNARPWSPTSSGLISHLAPPWNADLAREYIEIGAGLLLFFSESDTTVKLYLCSQSILSRFFQMFNKMEAAILLKLLKCINHLSTDPYCLENLQRADAIKHLIPNLDLKEEEGPLVSLIHHEVMNALFNLCKINKRRQEQAAENGIIPHLMHYIMSGSPLKEYAVPLLFDMAHASRTSREQLRAHGGLDVYLSLLEDDIWSVTALDSIAICLAHDNDNKKVEQALLRKDAVQKLVNFFQSCPERHFLHILEPFLKIITKSSRISNLAVNGLMPLLVSRLDHQDTIARLNLLRVIKAVYEHHPCPKQLIVENNLPKKLQNLIEERQDRQNSGGHVLVKQMATSLLKALHINTIL